MSTKFFTNAGENTLLKKLEGIFQHMDISFFDAVIGYFRTSGYFKIYPHLKNVEKVRILVGIDIDQLVYDAHRKGLEFRSAESVKDISLNSFKLDIQKSPYEKPVEEGILQFIEDISLGKIEIKAHPSKTLHAKVYIFRQRLYHQHASYGAVITGSSNLTAQGLEKNFEFNVELRDHDDILFAQQTFEELWGQGQVLTPMEIKGIKDETYLNNSFTPFELYIKFLQSYFGKSIDYDPEDAADLPANYMALRYQQDAVSEGYRKLRKYNGFFLADVVGLGKTIVACRIARKFENHNGRTRILIVHPPALLPTWKQAVRDFDVMGVEFVSNGSLHKVKHPEDFDLIIVDEAHKFRSDTAEMYSQLQRICKTMRKRSAPDGSRQKKVILISATPLNNKPEDIRNLILLFQDGRDTSLEIGSLIGFFRPLIDKYNKLKNKPILQAREEVKDIYAQIRIKVLEHILIRRTRSDIMSNIEYKEDIEKQLLRFPKIEKPIPLYYILDQKLNALHEYTMQMLQNQVTGLGYHRYQAISNILEEYRGKIYKKPEDSSRMLAFIMKTLLVKRLDSSFHSFILSLKKYRSANLAMIKMFENDRVHIAPILNVSAYILEDKEEELLEKMEAIRETEPSIQTYNANAFKPGFQDGLIKDQEILNDLCQQWEVWQNENEDPKLKEFHSKLDNVLLAPLLNPSGKLVVFSEYKDTTLYLKAQLERSSFRVLAVDSSNVKEYAERIRKNFDARLPLAEQDNSIDILITTEVLAEGVNLHRANTILNYDIPWNATKLMQRIGRVNRIGTKADKIYIYNFYPTEQTENEIYLKKKAVLKLQAFHSALGEDSQIYSSEEEFESFGLFEKTMDEERDERIEYLMELRTFRRENPDWFNKIQQMPLRARTGRLDKIKKNASLAYLRTRRRDGFYYIPEVGEVEELSFVECAAQFKAYASEKPVKLPEGHHKQVLRACEAFQNELNNKDHQNTHQENLGPSDQKAIKILSGIRKLSGMGTPEKELLSLTILAISRGRFQNLPREINKAHRSAINAKLSPLAQAEKIIQLLKKYPLSANYIPLDNDAVNSQGGDILLPEIIISESFS